MEQADGLMELNTTNPQQFCRGPRLVGTSRRSPSLALIEICWISKTTLGKPYERQDEIINNYAVVKLRQHKSIFLGDKLDRYWT